ncbi:uncharacterized protein EAF02_005177 [Botrytis sinoallii]|uniref:uncharacterized protein n=1 Tax=Botrytis sinoallii TaxID=1463999 RepID=UPI0018FF5A64|nr:uncharacterized protein EAF02_005177 [Botrytis sinoallii]KAF7883257.1 hypothetical protein EAF02_005177 [Botrytis sinoallii]
MVRYSGRHSEGKSTEDVQKNRQKSNPTPSKSSRNIRDNKGCGNNHTGQYWNGREWVLDPNLVKTIENLYDKLEAATKSKRELEEDMSCIESPPSDDLKVAAEAGLEAAFHSAKAELCLYKKAKTGSRSGSSTDVIEERKLLEATKKETIENMQAYDPDTHLAHKKIHNILEKRKPRNIKYVAIEKLVLRLMRR